MNRAEYIVAIVERANRRDSISQRASVRVLVEVAGLLNSGLPAAEIDSSPEMEKLWQRVSKKWGTKL